MKKQYGGGSALIFITAAAPLVLGMIAACSGGDPETSPAPSACSPDLASIRERIFVPSCAQAGCHGANEPAVGLNLSGPAQMPKQTALPDPQIQTIADWICGGALNN